MPCGDYCQRPLVLLLTGCTMDRIPPYKCHQCRQKTVFPKIEKYQSQVDHDGRHYGLVIPDLAVLECSNCNNRVRDREANARIDDALRSAAGFLLPYVIRQERLRLGFSQAHLAELLTVGEATLSRWETGAQIQSHHMDVMLRAFFEVPSFREYLENRLLIRNGMATPELQSSINA
jgi:putative zinc finger/helix-turn-helix YgiT family protein